MNKSTRDIIIIVVGFSSWITILTHPYWIQHVWIGLKKITKGNKRKKTNKL